MPKASRQRRSAAAKTRSSKRNKANPFLEPSPKHCKNEASTSTVTPSPTTNTSGSSKKQNVEVKSKSPWLAYDKLLRGAAHSPFVVDPDYYAKYIDKMYLPLFRKLDSLLDDPLFRFFDDEDDRDRYSYVEIREWRQYVLTLSTLPTTAIKQVMDEYAKDTRLHKDLLKALREEIDEKRYGGKRFYLRALNCMLFDSFVRCHVPLPPSPRWRIEVEIGVERKYLYLKQLRAWDLFRRRVFEVLKLVIANPTAIEGTIEVSAVVPLEHRGQMRPLNELCSNEEDCLPFIEVPWFDEDRLLNAEEKNVEDKPACGCRVCKRGFDGLIRRVVDARSRGIVNK